MSEEPKTVPLSTLGTAAMAILNEHAIAALFIVDEQRRPLGIVHFHDLLKAGVA